jgi:hypothetical protein
MIKQNIPEFLYLTLEVQRGIMLMRYKYLHITDSLFVKFEKRIHELRLVIPLGIEKGVNRMPPATISVLSRRTGILPAPCDYSVLGYLLRYITPERLVVITDHHINISSILNFGKTAAGVRYRVDSPSVPVKYQ